MHIKLNYKIYFHTSFTKIFIIITGTASLQIFSCYGNFSMFTLTVKAIDLSWKEYWNLHGRTKTCKMAMPQSIVTMVRHTKVHKLSSHFPCYCVLTMSLFQFDHLNIRCIFQCTHFKFSSWTYYFCRQLQIKDSKLNQLQFVLTL